MDNLPEIIERYSRIDLEGKRRLKESEITEFPGFSEKNDIGIVLVFDQKSEGILEQRITEPLKSIENDLGMKSGKKAAEPLESTEEKPKKLLVIAERDYPVHTTLRLSLQTKDSGEIIQDILNNLKQNPSLKDDSPNLGSLLNLKGIPIVYRYLLIAGGNLILVSTELPKEIVKARNAIDQYFSTLGIDRKPMHPGFLHITVARINKLPPDEQRKELLNIFKKKVIGLRHEILNNPITLYGDKILVGNTYDLYHNLASGV